MYIKKNNKGDKYMNKQKFLKYTLVPATALLLSTTVLTHAGPFISEGPTIVHAAEGNLDLVEVKNLRTVSGTGKKNTHEKGTTIYFDLQLKDGVKGGDRFNITGFRPAEWNVENYPFIEDIMNYYGEAVGVGNYKEQDITIDGFDEPIGKLEKTNIVFNKNIEKLDNPTISIALEIYDTANSFVDSESEADKYITEPFTLYINNKPVEEIDIDLKTTLKPQLRTYPNTKSVTGDVRTTHYGSQGGIVFGLYPNLQEIIKEIKDNGNWQQDVIRLEITLPEGMRHDTQQHQDYVGSTRVFSTQGLPKNNHVTPDYESMGQVFGLNTDLSSDRQQAKHYLKLKTAPIEDGQGFYRGSNLSPRPRITDPSILDWSTGELKDGKEIDVKIYLNDQLYHEHKIDQLDLRIPTSDIGADGLLKNIHRTETEAEVIPFNTVYQANNNKEVGHQEEIQPGIEGEKTIEYTVVFNPNTSETVSRDKTGESTTKEKQDRVVEVGTKEISQTSIPFETLREFNPNLPVGSPDVVARDGKEGTVTTTRIYQVNPQTGELVADQYQESVDEDPKVDELIHFAPTEVGYSTVYTGNPNLSIGETNLKQQGRPGLANPETGDVVTQPTDEVIEVGNKEVLTDTIPHDEIRQLNPNLPVDSPDVVVQEGSDGVMTITKIYHVNPENGELLPEYDESVEKVDKQDRIIEYAPKTVPFQSIIRENPELDEGERRVVQSGQPGQKDPETGEILVPPVDEIIEVGTGVRSIEENREQQPIPMEVIRQDNPNLPAGEERVVQEGHDGLVEVLTVQEMYNGEPIGQPQRTETVMTEMTPRIIEVGTGAKDLSETITETTIPFETIVKENPNLPQGARNVIQRGEGGLKQTIRRQETLNGQPIGEAIVEERIVKEPMDEIVEVGIGEVGEDIQTERREEDPGSEERENPNLPVGERRVIQEKQPRIIEVTTITPTINGQPSGEPRVTEKVIQPGQPEIIEIGTGEVTEDIQTEHKEEDLGVEERENPNLPEGERRVIQEGRPRIIEITTITKTVNGQPAGEPEVKEVVIDEGQPEIVEVGTYVEPTTPMDEPQEPQKPQEQPKPETKPDVKTGVEAVATNPTLWTTLGIAAAGVLSAFGIKKKRNKK